MVKLTPEMITEAAQCTNAIKDRELDLRGYKIPLIENLAATLDQFDTIDFSENEIHKLDGFPVLKRLKALIFNSNRLVRISEGLEHCIPNLDTLILTSNQIQELSDIDPLSSLKNLEFLVLSKNPLTMKPNYRFYVIHKLPKVRFLDYKRVRQREREHAATLFKTKKRVAVANGGPASISTPAAPGNVADSDAVTKRIGSAASANATTSVRTFTPGGQLPMTATAGAAISGVKRAAPAPSAQDLAAIRGAIKRAKTLDEVERLNQMLSSGSFAGFAAASITTPAEKPASNAASAPSSTTATPTATASQASSDEKGDN